LASLGLELAEDGVSHTDITPTGIIFETSVVGGSRDVNDLDSGAYMNDFPEENDQSELISRHMEHL
jgi:hypothetical protein